MCSQDLYTFEGPGRQHVSDFSTMDYDEARAYASEHGYLLIANHYEWEDSELVDDFTPEPEEV